MKKIFLIAAFGFALATLSAQVSTTVNVVDMKGPTYNLALDTVTNTGTNTVKVSFAQTYSYISIQPTVTKLSGTLTSNSTPQLQGSIDGTSWVNVTGDTLHITNTSSPISTIWTHTAAEGNKYYYYRVTYTGVGTMAATLKCKVMFRP